MIKASAFYWRCTKGPKLSDDEFRNLVETGLKKECHGIWCDLYCDWDKTQPLAWDTQSWSDGSIMSPSPENVHQFLQFYATQWVVKNKKELPGTINLNDYVTFRLIWATFTK